MINDQEILEAQKLIAGMRDDLALIAGATDAKKRSALVNQNVRWMLDSFTQLVERHQSTVFVRGPNYDPVAVYDAVLQGLMILMGFAGRKGLTDAVAKQVPLINSGLDKIEQALCEKAAKTE